MLDKDKAKNGFFNIQAVFTHPAAYSFPLGLTLSVFGVCDESYFDLAPVLSPDNQTYQVGEDALTISVEDLKNYVTQSASGPCGTSSIDIKFNSDASTIEGGPVDPTLTSLEFIEDTGLQFYSS